MAPAFKIPYFSSISKHHRTILIVIGLITWVNPDSFIWRDEWTFLAYFHNGNFQLLNGNPMFEVKPLFHYFLFAEFWLFGTNFFLYQLINAVLLTISGILFYEILLTFEIQPLAALLFALFYQIHPINFINGFWIFSQCEAIHLVLLLGALLAFQNYCAKGELRTLILFGGLLTLQNFFFPNGTFYSVLFLFFYLFVNRGKDFDARFAWTIALVFTIHLTHALYISIHYPLQNGLFSKLDKKALYAAELIANSIVRIIVPNASPFGSVAINLSIIGGFGFLSYFGYRKVASNAQKCLLLTLAGILFAAVTLVLTRFESPEILYYYTSLQLPFFVLSLAIIGNYLWTTVNKLITVALVVVLMGFSFADYKGKQIFASRNRANEAQMKEALIHRSYKPFDDPYFLPHDYNGLYQSVEDPEAAVLLYESLSKYSLF